MNDIGELKRFAMSHGRAPDVPLRQYSAVLDRITCDTDGAAGSWTREWINAAEQLEADERLLEACHYYNLARLPYIDGPARAEAMAGCVRVFDRWRLITSDLERLDIDTPEGTVSCWATGLSSTDRKPLIIFTGGIASIKEQWAPLLPHLRGLGVAAIATELPGVGESRLHYHADSHQLFSSVLDAVTKLANVELTYLMTLSFSGHLAMRAALADHRIRGIVTVGAPVHDFFCDARWWSSLPDVTVDTLSHVTGIARPDLPAQLSRWALSAHEIAALTVPLGYVACGRDEIIPPGEPAFLQSHARDLRLVEYPDVHGAPAHAAQMQAWALCTMASMLCGR
ncbi:alpha/beta fold hydrolase [Mycobacterium decipiens]|uniref:Alpha/beta hydrolase n=1 Tax=Mycobacterium decipiens TaxID=1430326 RepID=A0A1X2LVC6_9MYCO|nr:alpha/beta fold hydrolase [Mycobacterium decipiens]OSC40997.1 hypothetical protein B8W66_11150 [Mycobacterium decipiens]